MIELGERPETDPKQDGKLVNKFITLPDENGFRMGERGWLLALNKSQTEGIIKVGQQMLLIREFDDKSWPEEIERVYHIPKDFTIIDIHKKLIPILSKF